MHNHILIVEDEEKIASILKDYLEQNDYKTHWISNGSMVISYVKENQVDLILLDLMLPGLNGTEICKEIRKFSDLPIIMLTAKVDEIDRLIGLELGADDYICKPFSPREVVARVKSVLRRAHPTIQEQDIRLGPIHLNLDTRITQIKGKNLDLTPSEFGILATMAQHPNKVFSRNELLNKVLGNDFEGYDRTIDTHIKNLRKKITNAIPEQEIITSIYGVGYKLNITD
ncbi:MAG: response regulator [Deltaproteobacteria bacterium]|jgi:two-component system, OmpR family, response regulator BaeR|nr:response regulator [Deltaproteobacteria bacterium]MBT4525430.1 response regulator [Deltaproteobacteria bacterium]